MKEQEKLAVLARLASTDTVSLKQDDIESNTFQRTMDEYNAIERLMKKYGTSMLQADNLRKIMVRHLQQSDLTLNFMADKLFAHKLTGGIMNAFERPGHSTSNYMDTRNRAEETMFGYSTSNSHTGGNQGVFDRLKKFGDFIGNVDFTPSMRPKYGSLNYTNHRFGGAPNYGRSFMVLKEHVKHNCTFTDYDSFKYASNPSGGAKVATYTNMDRLISNLNDTMLSKLYTMVSTLGSQLAPLNYIEAQIHGEIRFGRDVYKMYIDTSEVANNPALKLRKHIDEFGRKFGIQVRYL